MWVLPVQINEEAEHLPSEVSYHTYEMPPQAEAGVDLSGVVLGNLASRIPEKPAGEVCVYIEQDQASLMLNLSCCSGTCG